MCSPKCSASTCGSKPHTADHYYDTIAAALATPAFRPRALFERFNIEKIATTEGALDPLDIITPSAQRGWTRPGRHHLSSR